jgi:hypothetical protein
MERGLGEWRRINVLYECDWMNLSMYATKPSKKTKTENSHWQEDSFEPIQDSDWLALDCAITGVDSGWLAYRAGSVEDLEHALLTVHLHLLPVGVLNGGVILLNKNALQNRKMCFKTFN